MSYRHIIRNSSLSVTVYFLKLNLYEWYTHEWVPHTPPPPHPIPHGPANHCVIQPSTQSDIAAVGEGQPSGPLQRDYPQINNPSSIPQNDSPVSQGGPEKECNCGNYPNTICATRRITGGMLR